MESVQKLVYLFTCSYSTDVGFVSDDVKLLTSFPSSATTSVNAGSSSLKIFSRSVPWTDSANLNRNIRNLICIAYLELQATNEYLLVNTKYWFYSLWIFKDQKTTNLKVFRSVNNIRNAEAY